MNKTTVIYHRADFDGIFCREIAKKFLPDAELIGWDYGDPVPAVSPDSDLYMLDISIRDGLMNHPRLVWIDHHKSAMEKFHHGIPGYRIDGVAACRLAWQWFSLASTALEGKFDFTKVMTYFGVARTTEGVEPHNNNVSLPLKEAYVDRTVTEPYAVRLAGEYDIWDKRDPNAEIFQLGLRSRELTGEDWKWLLTVRDNTKQGEYELAKTRLAVDELLHVGKLLQNYQRRQDALAMQNSFLVDFEGLKFLALNTQAKSSLAFLSKDVPETGHEALLKFSWNGSIWDVSLYHAKHNTGIDLSQIAVKLGGGGHRGACGFRVKTLPFLPLHAVHLSS